MSAMHVRHQRLYLRPRACSSGFALVRRTLNYSFTAYHFLVLATAARLASSDVQLTYQRSDEVQARRRELAMSQSGPYRQRGRCRWPVCPETRKSVSIVTGPPERAVSVRCLGCCGHYRGPTAAAHPGMLRCPPLSHRSPQTPARLTTVRGNFSQSISKVIPALTPARILTSSRRV